ncbi:hypothetical protein [Streptomyces xinghaiensis]|uniref:hypothetical protein n=1 Tax=Streptomyces xinghaiensis TaxID=1038928 RepID=UPI00343298D1
MRSLLTPVRLLPWPGPEGRRAYIPDDNPDGFLTKLADNVEAAQLKTGADVLDLARGVLDDSKATVSEVRYAAKRLAECLADALLVAESRGGRLGSPDPDEAVLP